LIGRLRSPLVRGLLACAAVLLVVSVADAALHDLLAQNPFGAPRPAQAAEPAASGVIGWLLAKQSEFYRQMSATIRAAKSDGSAVWTLLFISFAYGIFHAAGPGHGKAVIASYLVANRETARRGIALSFASALMQSLVAILIVGISAWVLNATAKTMCKAEGAIEIASYGLIALFGLRLVWVKGRTFIRALQAVQPVPAIAGVPHDHHDHGHHHHHNAHDHHDHDHGHDHHHHDHGHAHAHAHHHHGHVHDEHCGHSHGPTPSELAGPAVVAVSAKDIAARLSAGRDGGGALFMRGIEFGAAALVLLFGAGLLFGYIAAERTTCF